MMLIAGVDEVGYGALVGDVVVAAVIMPAKHSIKGIKDSKQLTAKQREVLFDLICTHALAWNIAASTHQEIDQLNILNATMLAMQRAVNGLSVKPDKVMIDGNKTPDLDYPVETVVQGDSLVEAIAAASIIAKVWRDRQMLELDKKHPQYGFAKHKGYCTQAHIAALNEYGPLKEHRRSYTPVALALRATVEV